jgi:hypothetical protein
MVSIPAIQMRRSRLPDHPFRSIPDQFVEKCERPPSGARPIMSVGSSNGTADGRHPKQSIDCNCSKGHSQKLIIFF